ncbi:MAG: acyl carrier protein [Pseudomonadota bacterium]
MTKPKLNGHTAGLVSTDTDDLIFQKVCGLLAPYNRNELALTRSTIIMSDLEIDSVSVFDLIMEVEDTYDITFPMETVSSMRSIGDLVDTIRALKAA